MSHPTSGTRFATSPQDRVVLVLALVAVGVVLGFVLPWLGTVAARFPLPFGEVIERLSAFDSPLVVTLRPIIGGALGGIAGLVLASQTVDVTIEDEQVLVTKSGETRALRRSDIAGVYRRGSNVVIETESGRVLLDEQLEGHKDEVADAFIAHGYPWEMMARS